MTVEFPGSSKIYYFDIKKSKSDKGLEYLNLTEFRKERGLRKAQRNSIVIFGTHIRDVIKTLQKVQKQIGVEVTPDETTEEG
jgi:hypothetical protein